MNYITEIILVQFNSHIGQRPSRMLYNSGCEEFFKAKLKTEKYGNTNTAGVAASSRDYQGF